MSTPSEQGTANIEVWGKSYHQLDGALRLYDEKDSLPDTAVFTASKKSHQAKIDQILDALILVLNTSGAQDCRGEIETHSIELIHRLLNAVFKPYAGRLDGKRQGLFTEMAITFGNGRQNKISSFASARIRRRLVAG